MKAMEIVVVSMLALGILSALLHAALKAYRDVQILRLLRGTIAECTPDERMRLCLELAQALRGAACPPPEASAGQD
ncbi:MULTISPECIES: hypothetical protein [unclassified Streptomyces]|uniref:hypothetical protein n=1 Tax=unclassified Streptomyces TaxID=2593676 RepID=UPI0022863726|nr:hypothetical protein [Streptomyces sp. Je 1-369]WAL98046.1 hypothetical protein NOO62_28310 [Streptomyces sp. Je 1-369]